MLSCVFLLMEWKIEAGGAILAKGHYSEIKRKERFGCNYIL